jgi:hypothetical protein
MIAHRWHIAIITILLLSFLFQRLLKNNVYIQNKNTIIGSKKGHNVMKRRGSWAPG